MAVVAMTVVGFGVLFVGVVSSVLAGSSTSLLLAFVLPVTLPGSASDIPARLGGWGAASAVSILAIRLLWPAPARDPLRSAAATAIGALAARLRAEVEFARGPIDASPVERDAAIEKSQAAAAALRCRLLRRPLPPNRSEHFGPNGRPAGR